MDTLMSAINMMRPNCHMVSVDLKDTYYSVPIAHCDPKCLKSMKRWVRFTSLHVLPTQIYKTVKTSLCHFKGVWSFIILLYR